MSLDTAFTTFPILTTRRLRLREIRTADADALFAMFSDEEVMKFNGHPAQITMDDTLAWIERVQNRYRKREGFRWGITLHGQDTVIGTCSFHGLSETHHYVEIGYELHRDFWGQGIMTEAVSAVLDFGFTELGMNRVEARIDIANERSKKLLERLGFTYEGHLRQRFFLGDRYDDDHYFGLLKHEWLGRR